jgi:septal ring factor EnvC (AmiA/AmiB activator)
MKKGLFIFLVFIVACQNKSIENKVEITDTLKVYTVDTAQVVVTDTVLEKISSLMHSTENAHKKVKEIKVLKTENKELKHDLIETTSQLEKAKEEIKKLDSVVTSTKKRNFLQKIVDNFKDTTNIEK